MTQVADTQAPTLSPPGLGWSVVVTVFAALAVGLWLDASESPGYSRLFWTLSGASAWGACLGLWWRRFELPGLRLVWALLVVFLLWRLSYFPVLVFSGFIASLGEVLLFTIKPGWVLIYPTFLLATAVQHAVIAFFVLAALSSKPAPTDRPNDARQWLRWGLRPPTGLVLGLSAPMLLVAALVSCNAKEDLTLFPPTPVTGSTPLPQPVAPAANPYLGQVTGKGFNISQRVLLFCAGMTYPMIPESPWAFVVKGTLESLARQHPKASARQRIIEHYNAYLVAHPSIGATHPQGIGSPSSKRRQP